MEFKSGQCLSRSQGPKGQPSESPINNAFTSLFIDYEL